MAEKTNAIRLLENGNVPFRFYEYDVSDGRIDGKSIAELSGIYLGNAAKWGMRIFSVLSCPEFI